MSELKFEDLEFETLGTGVSIKRFRLVKVRGMRPQYMSGQALINLVGELAILLKEAKSHV